MKITEPTLFKLPRKIKQAKKKKQVIQQGKKTTYKRKYYLHRRIKSIGALLELERCTKTILIKPDLVDQSRDNKYIIELQQNHNYGVQILNPMTNQ